MHRGLSLAIAVCLAGCGGRAARAQSSRWAFWPQAELYVPARSALQLELLTGWSADQDSSYRQLQLGGYVRWRVVRHLVLQTGYSDYQSPAEPSKDENRVVAEFTPDFNLPAELVLLDRNRFEWRWVGGNYSTRYRNRLRLQRTVPLEQHHTITPYFEVEVYYAFFSQQITRVKEQIGAVYLVTRGFTIDGGFVHQNDLVPSVNNVDALELTVRFYW